ncbi:hypothetical protein [Streptomyces sp. NPDC093225]|uniref:hypothetical protein n=1 Tax=Streptomyces sp. NPDC093225 TaxID=3366034 RepID=UPI0038289559
MDFYWDDSVLRVVNGNSRVIPMRLTLPERKVFWDLDLVKPCKSLLIPDWSLQASMVAEEPSVTLTEGDLAKIRLEFMDPNGNAWERISGRGLTRTGALEAVRQAQRRERRRMERQPRSFTPVRQDLRVPWPTERCVGFRPAGHLDLHRRTP